MYSDENQRTNIMRKTILFITSLVLITSVSFSQNSSYFENRRKKKFDNENKIKKNSKKETLTELNRLIDSYYGFKSSNTKIIKRSYPYGDSIIGKRKDIIFIKFMYNDTPSNYEYEKEIIFNVKMKKYQYVSFRIPIIVDYDNYRGLEENFGFEYWEDLPCEKPSDKYDEFICGIFHIINNP